MPLSKFEANPTLRRGVKRTSFSLFTLASSCANAYFREYAIIYFLTNRLVFLNTVTYMVLFYLFSTFSPLVFPFIPLMSYLSHSSCFRITLLTAFFLISSPTFWICPFFIYYISSPYISLLFPFYYLYYYLILYSSPSLSSFPPHPKYPK